MAEYLIFFLLFLLPFIIFPVGISPFEYSKVILGEIVILFLISLSFLRREKGLSFSDIRKWLKRKWLFKENLPSSCILVGLGVLTLFTFLLHPTSLSFFGNAFRGQGAFLFILLLAFSYLSCNTRLPRFSSWVALLFLGVQVTACLVIADKDGRAIGTIGEPNSLAAYAVSTWVFLFLAEKRRKLLIVTAFCLAIVLVIFSGSRSGLVALSLQLLFLLMSRFVSLPKTIVVIILIFVATLLPPMFDTKTMYENRGEIWQTALIAGYKHPFVGYGFGNTEVAFKEYNKKLYNRLRGYYVDSSHNIFLDMWVQGGVIGLSLFLLLLVERMREFIRSKNTFALLLLIGLITCMSFNPVSVVILLQFWWLMGGTPPK